MNHLAQYHSTKTIGATRRLACLAGLCLVLALPGCGFALRNSQQFAFETVAVTPEKGTGIAAELARNFGAKLRPLAPSLEGTAPDAVVDILEDFREKAVTGVNASGQVRELQLRLRVRFRLRTPTGVELIAPTTVRLQRDMSFSESAVLAKEAEERLLYRDMQTDAVQQLVRRLAAVKSLAP